MEEEKLLRNYTEANGTKVQIIQRADGRRVKRTTRVITRDTQKDFIMLPSSDHCRKVRAVKRTKGKTCEPQKTVLTQVSKEVEKALKGKATEKHTIPVTFQQLEGAPEAKDMFIEDIAEMLLQRMAETPGIQLELLVKPKGEERTSEIVPAKASGVAEGMELVTKEVAEAGRTVMELGITDMKSLVGDDKASILKQLKFANYRKEKLEQQLIQAGITPADGIAYEEAKEKIITMGKRLLEIGGNDVVRPDKVEQARLRKEYHELTCEMERIDAALVLTKEYREEQSEKEHLWESKHAAENEAALKKIRRHMPLECRSMTVEGMARMETPSGKNLPKSFARKFERTNVLKLVRCHPDEILKMHPSYLNSLGVMGMTLTEKRAVHAQLRKVASEWEAGRNDQSTGLKWKWYQGLRNKLMVDLEELDRHCSEHGHENEHKCPFGLRCPLRQDKKCDYSGDYGFPEEEVYVHATVGKVVDAPGAQALKEIQALANGRPIPTLSSSTKCVAPSPKLGKPVMPVRVLSTAEAAQDTKTFSKAPLPTAGFLSAIKSLRQ